MILRIKVLCALILKIIPILLAHLVIMVEAEQEQDEKERQQIWENGKKQRADDDHDHKRNQYFHSCSPLSVGLSILYAKAG